MWGFSGIQKPPPDTAVVPPIRPVFSSSITLAHLTAATSAPVNAAPPEPNTTKSPSSSHESGTPIDQPIISLSSHAHVFRDRASPCIAGSYLETGTGRAAD